MEKVSVIIPVYNVVKYIDKCINSVINQTYANLEIIIIDDGSTDHSGLICDAYAKLDKRIIVVHKTNGGLSSARNVGINESTGEFLSFIDSDDYVEKDMIEKLVGSCLTNSADIAVCGRFRVVNGKIVDENSQRNPIIWGKDEAVERLLTRTNIDHSVCDKLFRKRLFDGLRFPVGRYYEDMFVTVKLLYRTNSVVHIGETKYYYLNRDDSITHEEFSPRKIDYYYACLDISDFITKEMPRLKEKSNHLINESILQCLFSMQSIEDRMNHKDEYKMLVSVARNHFFSVIQQRNIKIIKKLAFILICMDFYPPNKRVSHID
jgi:glycosyltransferase involved in cell wall biosynthesis